MRGFCEHEDAREPGLVIANVRNLFTRKRVGAAGLQDGR